MNLEAVNTSDYNHACMSRPTEVCRANEIPYHGSTRFNKVGR